MINARCQWAFTTMSPNTDAVILMLYTEPTSILKYDTRHLCTKFVIDHTIEDSTVCDAASKVAAAMVQAEKPRCCKRRQTFRAYTCCLANDANS
ncbi:hypothetical protein TNCV_118891 [Trichonephila clavipes]|nr:hypothetical protein TNCV_118891 [Trichonephila clavipes]